MTDTPPPKRTTGAIQKAVQVRRTQEIALQQEQRRQNERLSAEEKKALEEARNQNVAKPATNPAARSTAIHSAVSTGTVPAVSPAPRPSLTDAVLERTGWTRAQLQIAIIAMLAILLVCGIGSMVALLASPATNSNTFVTRLAPTELAIPAIPLADLPEKFRQLGFTLSSVQNLTVPSANWQATKGIRFDAVQGKEHGTFLLLSYPDINLAGQDSYRANISETWTKWKRRQYETLLIIASPDTTDTLMAAIDNAIFTNYILPYRTWMLTPLPKVTPTK